MFSSKKDAITILTLIAQWKILASAQKFLAFLGGYTIFLGPMTAIIMTEYVSTV
jgi:cytosine/uracil/thiamine/allantoin permease